MINLPQFKNAKLNQLVTAIRELQDASGTAASSSTESHEPQKDMFANVFDAEIDGVNAGGDRYSWHEVTNISGAVATFTDGRSCNSADDGSAAVEVNGWLFVPAGKRVRMVEIRDGDTMRYEFVNPVPPPADQTGATDYILGYSGSAQDFTWYLQNTCTPPE